MSDPTAVAIPINFSTSPENDTARAHGADSGCLDGNTASDAAPISPRRWSELACASPTPAAPREFRIKRGEASGHLDFVGNGQGDFQEIRGVLSLEHALGLGMLGNWQLHGDAFVGHPTATPFGLPVDEQTHVSVSRGLPWGINLRLGAGAAAQGAFDPRAAPDQSTELAAELSRGFRLSAAGTEHRLSLKLGEQSALDRPSGTEQTTTLTSLSYTHALDLGSIAADVAFTRAAPVAGPSQSAARAQIKFTHPF